MTNAKQNNDGLDDFFCIKPSSVIAVSLNRGDRVVDGRRVPIFESIGDVTPAHAGFEAADVRISGTWPPKSNTPRGWLTAS